MMPGRNDQRHDNEAEVKWKSSLFQNAHRYGESIGEFAVEGSSANPSLRRDANYSEITSFFNNNIRQN